MARILPFKNINKNTLRNTLKYIYLKNFPKGLRGFHYTRKTQKYFYTNTQFEYS